MDESRHWADVIADNVGNAAETFHIIATGLTASGAILLGIVCQVVTAEAW